MRGCGSDGGVSCQRGSQPGSQDTLCRPLETKRKTRERERVREGGRRRERRRERHSQNKTQKPEATSQPGRHSDPTQVVGPERSQIVLCDTRAIQREQDAVCGMSQTPRRCIVVCVFLCVCVHVWPSVDSRERPARQDLTLFPVKRLTVNERLIDKLN